MSQSKRYPSGSNLGQETRGQIEHSRVLGASATFDVLAPGTVVTPATTVRVLRGNLVRIELAADTFVAFSKAGDLASVNSSTSPAIKLPAGYHILRATEDFMQASAAPDRIEIIECF